MNFNKILSLFYIISVFEKWQLHWMCWICKFEKNKFNTINYERTKLNSGFKINIVIFQVVSINFSKTAAWKFKQLLKCYRNLRLRNMKLWVFLQLTQMGPSSTVYNNSPCQQGSSIKTSPSLYNAHTSRNVCAMKSCEMMKMISMMMMKDESLEQWGMKSEKRQRKSITCNIIIHHTERNLANYTNVHVLADYCKQSMPITMVRRSWPMQIVKGSLYVKMEILKMTDVS